MATTAWIGGGSSVKQRLISLRAFRSDSNPLFRAVDRAESVVITVLTGALVVTWLALAILAGQWADHQSLLIEHAESSWRPVWATQQESGAQGASTTELDVAWVQATWTSDGHSHPVKDGIAVPLNSRPGQRWEIYVNRAGQEVGDPLTADGVLDQVAFTEFSVTMGLAIVYGIAFWLVRLLFNRRRMAGWERDWEAIGPSWSHQG
jgi:hypothetical protein